MTTTTAKLTKETWVFETDEEYKNMIALMKKQGFTFATNGEVLDNNFKIVGFNDVCLKTIKITTIC
jgi:hypothetical protein